MKIRFGRINKSRTLQYDLAELRRRSELQTFKLNVGKANAANATVAHAHLALKEAALAKLKPLSTADEAALSSQVTGCSRSLRRCETARLCRIGLGGRDRSISRKVPCKPTGSFQDK